MNPLRKEVYRDYTLSTLWDRVWDRAFDEKLSWGGYYATNLYPAVNTFEKDGKFHVTAELPGVKKEDITVSLDKGLLTIRAEKKETRENYQMKEISYGSFERSLLIPEGEVEAEFKDGVLTVAIKVKGGEVPKKIEVK